VSKKNNPKSGLVYVIQKHQSSHLHYDLRLEVGGLLKSWAIPRKPEDTRGLKRLSVQVEDHPPGYEKFEGTIPEGQPGAGKVEIWDNGFYQPVSENKDRMEILIRGRKLEGLFTLIRRGDRQKDKKNLWLFFKNKNQKIKTQNEKD
jgi:DNA ligase D-like protein (predicted 3'-phosphoesterase)